MNRINGGSNKDIRNMLDDFCNAVVEDGTRDDTALRSILNNLAPSSKRSLIVSGALRAARQADFSERMEWRSRNHSEE